MSTPQIPSKPPAIDGDLGAAFSFIFEKLLQNTDGQLPAEVVSYNRASNRALVRPLISIISTSGQRIGRAEIAAVPVLALGGGNFFINFPLGPGDTGWIEASDRDISLFLQSMQLSPPYDGRIHSFEHGRFIPDAFDKYTFTPDANALVISSLDGSTRLVMSAGKISVIAANVEVDASTKFKVVSPVIELDGQLTQGTAGGGYPATLQGPVTVVNDLTAAGKSVSTHTHHENGAGSNTNPPN